VEIERLMLISSSRQFTGQMIITFSQWGYQRYSLKWSNYSRKLSELKWSPRLVRQLNLETMLRSLKQKNALAKKCAKVRQFSFVGPG